MNILNGFLLELMIYILILSMNEHTRGFIIYI